MTFICFRCDRSTQKVIEVIVEQLHSVKSVAFDIEGDLTKKVPNGARLAQTENLKQFEDFCLQKLIKLIDC